MAALGVAIVAFNAALGKLVADIPVSSGTEWFDSGSEKKMELFSGRIAGWHDQSVKPIAITEFMVDLIQADGARQLRAFPHKTVLEQAVFPNQGGYEGDGGEKDAMFMRIHDQKCGTAHVSEGTIINTSKFPAKGATSLLDYPDGVQWVEAYGPAGADLASVSGWLKVWQDTKNVKNVKCVASTAVENLVQTAKAAVASSVSPGAVGAIKLEPVPEFAVPGADGQVQQVPANPLVSLLVYAKLVGVAVPMQSDIDAVCKALQSGQFEEVESYAETLEAVALWARDSLMQDEVDVAIYNWVEGTEALATPPSVTPPVAKVSFLQIDQGQALPVLARNGRNAVQV